MFGGYGNDTIDFGIGNTANAAAFSGNFNDYMITIEGDFIVVSDKRSGSDGIDHVRGADALIFADGVRGVYNLTVAPAPNGSPLTGVTTENVNSVLHAF